MGLFNYLSGDNSPGTGLGKILGGLGNLLAYGPFVGAHNDAHARLLQKQQQDDADEALDRQYKQAQIAALGAKQNRRQIVQLGNGGVASVDPDTNELTMLQQPTQDKTPLQRNFEYFQTLSPDQQKLVRPMMQGYGYTPEGQAAALAQAGAIANAQGAARAKYRAPRAVGAPGVPAASGAGLISTADLLAALGHK